MKNISTQTVGVVIALGAVIAFSGCASNQAEKVYPYPFDTAKIEYQLTGNVEGSTTVHIKGDKSAHETKAKSVESGNEAEINTLLLDLEDKLYQIDLTAKTGNSSDNPIYAQLKELTPEERLPFLTKLATGLVADGGQTPTPKGQKNVAGETCDLYDIQGIGEICLWNGIPVYSSMTIPEAGIMSTNTATSIQLNVAIPDSVFNVPEGVEITDLSVQ